MFLKNLFLILFFWINLSSGYCFTILIDPGHGGEDRGAVKNINLNGKEQLILEKDINLLIAQKVYERLKKHYTVFLTRSIDRSVSLMERAQMADKVKADLFISIHANSSKEEKSKGFEVYYLDNHQDQAVKKIEDVENEIIKDLDPMVHKILIDLVIKQTAPKSKRLANLIHEKIKNGISSKYKIVDRGVRAGLFFVLALSKRPAILLETGFISNPQEVQKLINPTFQNDYAHAIEKAIEKFIEDDEVNSLALF